MAIALEIEEKKYGKIRRFELVAYTNFVSLFHLHDYQFMQKMILDMGEKVLKNEVLLNLDVISKQFPDLLKIFPAKQQLENALTNRITDGKEEQNLSQPEEQHHTIEVAPQKTELIIHRKTYPINIQTLPPMFKAVYFGDVGMVKQLHDEKMNIYHLIPFCNIVIDIISFAALLGKDEILKYFLYLSKCFPEARQIYSPLFWAIVSDQPSTVKLMVDHYQKNTMDLSVVSQETIHLPVGNHSISELYIPHSPLDCAIERNVKEVIETILPFATQYSSRSIQQALKCENEAYLMQAIASQQFSIEDWLRFVFDSNDFHVQPFRLNILARVLLKENIAIEKSELKGQLNDYFRQHPDCLVFLIRQTKLKQAGIELLFNNFMLLEPELSFENKLCLLATTLKNDYVEFANKHLPFLYSDLEKMSGDDKQKNYAWLFEALLLCYKEKIKQDSYPFHITALIQSELSKLASIDFEEKSKLIVITINKLLQKNIANKIEKTQFLFYLLNLLPELEITRGLMSDEAATFIMLSMDHYSKFSSEQQASLMKIIEIMRNKNLLDPSIEKMVLEKFYAIEVYKPSILNQLSGNQLSFFNPKPSEERSTDHCIIQRNLKNALTF